VVRLAVELARHRNVSAHVHFWPCEGHLTRLVALEGLLQRLDTSLRPLNFSSSSRSDVDVRLLAVTHGSTAQLVLRTGFGFCFA